MSFLKHFALAGALLLGSLAPNLAFAEKMSDVLVSAPEHGKLQSFSKPEFYIKAGGTPPTLEALAANPRAYFRHEVAYDVFKRGFEIQLGKKLGDGALKRLLGSTKVELRDCVGSFRTTGVDRNGNVAWFTRACAKGEQLLWLTTNGKRVVVASMGCLNLVDAPVVGKPPAPVVMTSSGESKPTPAVTPPPPPAEEPCKGKGCEPPPPPPAEEPCEEEDKPKPEKPKGNNGWGNGDQDAPGKSADNNNAENNTSGKDDPSHGGNSGGNGNGQGNGGNNGNQGGGKGEGKGKKD